MRRIVIGIILVFLFKVGCQIFLDTVSGFELAL